MSRSQRQPELPPEPSFAERLRTHARAGSPVEFLSGAWAEFEAEIAQDIDGLEQAFAEAADIGDGMSGAAVGLREALTMGVVAADGTLQHAEPQFRAWFADPGADGRFQDLVARARKQGASLGLVETDDGVVLAAWAGPGDTAARWPLSEPARLALAAPARLAIVVFAPSRSSALARRAATAFDLAPAEARLAQAMLFAPSLEMAAAEIGVGRETARDTLKRIMAKAGVRRSTALISRLVQLMGSGGPETPHADARILVATFGLTTAEARVAAACAAGLTAKQTAEAFGLKSETVRGYIKSVLAKTGLSRARDLARLLVEARELAFLSEVADPVFESSKTAGRLRVIQASDPGRQIAFIDYGPRSGEPVLVFHGFAAGRTLPAPLVQRMHAQGLRPIVPQRPGFGLTDPAQDDYLACAADDLARLINQLQLRRTRIFARDGGAAVALELARRHPDAADRFLLLNPRTPKAWSRTAPNLVTAFSQRLMSNPRLVGPVTEFLRRNATRSVVESNLRQTCAAAAADRACLEDRATVDGLVRDIQALTARSALGFAAEYAVYANGWIPPPGLAGSWTVLWSGDLAPEPPEAWRNLPNVRYETLEGGGLLTQLTHPDALTAAILAL